MSKLKFFAPLILSAVLLAIALGSSGCASSGSREYRPGHGWQPVR